MSAHDERCRHILDRIKEVAGEHCGAFVFIGEVTDPEDDGTNTVMTWDGGFNTAAGLVERAKGRMRQNAKESDFPDDPPDGEDWKHIT